MKLASRLLTFNVLSIIRNQFKETQNEISERCRPAADKHPADHIGWPMDAAIDAANADEARYEQKHPADPGIFSSARQIENHERARKRTKRVPAWKAVVPPRLFCVRESKKARAVAIDQTFWNLAGERSEKKCYQQWQRIGACLSEDQKAK